MDQWQLLSFPTRSSYDMIELKNHTSGDIKIGDKVRVFMVKPKGPHEVIHDIDEYTEYDGLNLRIHLRVRCIDPNSTFWMGTLKTDIHHPIQRTKNYDLVTIDDFYVSKSS